MVGSYFSMKWPDTNWTVSADLPTPPDPSTTTLNSFIAAKLQDLSCQTISSTFSPPHHLITAITTQPSRFSYQRWLHTHRLHGADTREPFSITTLLTGSASAKGLLVKAGSQRVEKQQCSGRGAAVQGLGARPCSIARRSGNLKKAALGTFSEKGIV